MRISDWSSDVCSSDLPSAVDPGPHVDGHGPFPQLRTVVRGGPYRADEVPAWPARRLRGRSRAYRPGPVTHSESVGRARPQGRAPGGRDARLGEARFRLPAAPAKAPHNDRNTGV